jgi:hypothetical protein
MATDTPQESTARASQLSALAQRVVDATPPQLASLAIAGGSIANGLADRSSDVEIHMWAPAMPSLAERKAYLDGLGADDLWWHEQPGKDGSEWVRFRLWNEHFEVGWQSRESFDAVVSALADGDPWAKGRIGIGWVIAHGQVLRGQTAADAARQRLLPYRAPLARIVAGATVENQWCDPVARRQLIVLAKRDQWLVLTDKLLTDAYAVLRVLFAANRRYEPPTWKWLEAEASHLTAAPDRCVPRLRSMLDDAQRHPRRAVAENRDLVVETIQLAADTSGFTLADTGVE